jgi:hypothetical protein
MDAKDFQPVNIEPPNHNIAEARQSIWTNRHKGTSCPCCGQKCRVYQRKITKAMIRWLVSLVQVCRQEGGQWIDINHPLLKKMRGGDYARLRHWGLIEPQQKTTASRVQTTKWRPTERGILFIDREERVPKYTHMYLGKCIGFSGPTMTVDEVYGEYFDYSEILQNRRGGQ